MNNQLSKDTYNSSLQKAGAVMDDMRLLVRNWTDSDIKPQQEKVITENVLGKETRSRSVDTLRRTFIPRFVKGDPPKAWKIIRPLEDRNVASELITPIYYWVTARAEPLIYRFMEDEILPRSQGVDQRIRIDETKTWITRVLSETDQEWSDVVTTKVARGLLAALRDFGILKGKSKKEIDSAYLPIESFSYIAFALSKLGASGERLVQHPDWKLFLMTPPVVERLFLAAHQQGHLRYESAGRIHRIEFNAATFEEMADVVTGKAF